MVVACIVAKMKTAKAIEKTPKSFIKADLLFFLRSFPERAVYLLSFDICPPPLYMKYSFYLNLHQGIYIINVYLSNIYHITENTFLQVFRSNFDILHTPKPLSEYYAECIKIFTA